jgi:hypothetical protein
MVSGFAVCGENPASVSRFVAKIRIERYRRDFLHSRWEPKPPVTFDQLIGVLQQHFLQCRNF